MKCLARERFWWRKMDDDVENFVKSCDVCNEHQNSNSNRNLCPWKASVTPFERIHLDFFHLFGTNFLILVDSFTKFIQVWAMKDMTCSEVSSKLRTFFSTFGIPEELVTDGGPPFQSSMFAEFCNLNGIRMLKSPPYHPQSNGLAERVVQTVKVGLKKALSDPSTKGLKLQIQLDNWLFRYRNTVSTSIGESPNSKLFKYSPRTLIDYATGKRISQNTIDVPLQTHTNELHNELKSDSNDQNNIKIKKTFVENEMVYYQLNFKMTVRWIKATIVQVLSNIRYKINVNGKFKIAHVDQLRKAEKRKILFLPKTKTDDKPESGSDFEEWEEKTIQPNNDSVEYIRPLRRSKRNNQKVSYRYRSIK